MTYIYFHDKAESPEDEKLVEQAKEAVKKAKQGKPKMAPNTMNMGGNPNMIQITTGDGTSAPNLIIKN